LKFGNQLGNRRSRTAGLLARARSFVLGLRGGGAVGVVVDLNGDVLGSYCDPYTDPRRPARLHTTGSPWVGAAGGWAWEGFGESHQAALASANRLRRRHRRLVRAMHDDGPDLRFRASTTS
jgi:hypothetical protein